MRNFKILLLLFACSCLSTWGTAWGQAGGEQGQSDKDPFQTLLEKKIDKFEVRGKTLNEAIAEFRKATGLNVVVDPGVLEKVKSSSQPVDLELHDIQAQGVLATLLRMFNLAADFQNEVVYITSPDSLSKGQEVVTETYNIRSFVYERPQFGYTALPFSLEESTLRLQRRYYSFYDEDDIETYLLSERRRSLVAQERAEERGRELVEHIKNIIHPASWREDGRVGVYFNPEGTLTVTHTWDVHLQILTLFNAMPK